MTLDKLLCSLATWWMIDRLVGQRIRTLQAGAQRVAQKDLTRLRSQPHGQIE